MPVCISSVVFLFVHILIMLILSVMTLSALQTLCFQNLGNPPCGLIVKS